MFQVASEYERKSGFFRLCLLRFYTPRLRNLVVANHYSDLAYLQTNIARLADHLKQQLMLGQFAVFLAGQARIRLPVGPVGRAKVSAAI